MVMDFPLDPALMPQTSDNIDLALVPQPAETMELAGEVKPVDKVKVPVPDYSQVVDPTKIFDLWTVSQQTLI
jgi:hypothetical protein